MNSQIENSNRKKEILARNRQSSNDEGIEYAVNKGIKLGYYYTEAVGLALVMFAFFTGHFLVIHAVLTLYGAYCFGEFIAKYRYFNQKRYLIGASLFGALFGCVFAFLFVRGVGVHQGWWG